MNAKVSKEEFTRLVRQHAAAVISLTDRLLADRREAEEVAQDAFVKAFQQFSSFRGDSSFLTWVQRIACHEALDRLRRRQPCMVDLGEMELATEDVDDFSTGREERILLMEEAVDRLPADDQLLLHLYYYEDRPLREIGYIMEAEPNTLSQRLRRIRKRLMTMILQRENEQNK